MYNIGDKVKTNKGDGIIVAISGYEEPLYIVKIKEIGEWGFNEHQLKPYRTDDDDDDGEMAGISLYKYYKDKEKEKEKENE